MKHYYIVKDANASAYLHKNNTFYTAVCSDVLCYKTRQGAMARFKKLYDTYGIKELFPELRIREADAHGNVNFISFDIFVA